MVPNLCRLKLLQAKYQLIVSWCKKKFSSHVDSGTMTTLTGHDLSHMTPQQDDPMTDQDQAAVHHNNDENNGQHESSEGKALRIPLIVDTILNFADFDSLEVCRRVSSFFNSLAATQIHRQHYLTLRLNRAGEIEDDRKCDAYQTIWSSDEDLSSSASSFSSDPDEDEGEEEEAPGSENDESESDLIEKTIEKEVEPMVIVTTNEEPELIEPELKQVDRLLGYLSSYGGRVQFKNLKLNLRISPRWSSTPLVEICTPFSHQVTHLRVNVDVHSERIDIVMETIHLFQNLQSLHLSFYGVPRRDLSQTDLFLQIVRPLLTLKLDQVGWPSLLSFLKLGKEAPLCIKKLVVLDDTLVVTPDFIKLYTKAVKDFGFKWTIPHIGLELSNPSHVSVLWKFLQGYQPTVQKLSLDLSYHRWNDDEDETAVLNFPPMPPPPHQNPTKTKNGLTHLKMEYDHRDAVSFWARRFIGAISLATIKEIQLDDFYLNFPLKFEDTKSDNDNDVDIDHLRTNWTPCPDHLRTILQICSGLERQKRTGEAMALHKKIFHMYKSTLGSKNQLTIEAHLALVYCLICHGNDEQRDEGLSLYLELLKILKLRWNKNKNVTYSLPTLCPLTMDSWTFFKKHFKKQKTLPEDILRLRKTRTNLAQVNKIASTPELQKLVKKFCTHEDQGAPLFIQLAEIYSRALEQVLSIVDHQIGGATTSPLENIVKNNLTKLRNSGQSETAADEALAIFRTVFEIRPYNSKGFPAALGIRCGEGGDSGLPSSLIFYCGRERGGACRCGQCDDDLCGPLSGCPCGACVELLGFKVNRDNVLCKKGSGEWGTGGDTGLRPKEIYFCGRRKNECRCRGCDGCCGPNDGCPCNSCKLLLQH